MPPNFKELYKKYKAAKKLIQNAKSKEAYAHKFLLTDREKLEKKTYNSNVFRMQKSKFTVDNSKKFAVTTSGE